MASGFYPSRVVELRFGKGLAATRDMQQGETVEKFEGPVVPYAKVPASELQYVLWIGPDLWLIPESNARYANHSCDPNCTLSKDHVMLTTKSVKEGEALTFSYNVTYEDGEWDPIWTFKCECGAANCQGLIDRYVDSNHKPFH